MSEQKESVAADFGERIIVELPMMQTSNPIRVSFVPLAAGVVAEHVGALPSDANVTEDGARPKTFAERAKDVEDVNARLIKLMAAADTRPRFVSDGEPAADGQVRWSLLWPENQTALMLAVMEASGFRTGESSKTFRFLANEGRTEGSA